MIDGPPKEVLDTQVGGYNDAENLIRDSGLLKQLRKQLLECVPQTDTTEYLGREKAAPAINEKGNTHSVPKKTAMTCHDLLFY